MYNQIFQGFGQISWLSMKQDPIAFLETLILCIQF